VRHILLSLFFSYEMQVQRKGMLTMKLSLTLWHEWLLHNLLPPLFSFQIPLKIDSLLNYETSTIKNNGTPSPPSGLVFNIA
jgi:hypothetical protein